MAGNWRQATELYNTIIEPVRQANILLNVENIVKNIPFLFPAVETFSFFQLFFILKLCWLQ